MRPCCTSQRFDPAEHTSCWRKNKNNPCGVCVCVCVYRIFGEIKYNSPGWQHHHHRDRHITVCCQDSCRPEPRQHRVEPEKSDTQAQSSKNVFPCVSTIEDTFYTNTHTHTPVLQQFHFLHRNGYSTCAWTLPFPLQCHLFALHIKRMPRIIRMNINISILKVILSNLDSPVSSDIISFTVPPLVKV